MPVKVITIPVRLDARTFYRFSVFHMLRLRRAWVRPLGFALILCAFALVAALSGRPESGLITGVLLTVGLGLPAVWLGTFFFQLRRQARAQKLPREVYTVVLSPQGVRVTSAKADEAPLDLPWKQLQAAFRRRGCIYLYVNAARAFLLPDGQASAPADAVWAFLKERMGAGKCRG